MSFVAGVRFSTSAMKKKRADEKKKGGRVLDAASAQKKTTTNPRGIFVTISCVGHGEGERDHDPPYWSFTRNFSRGPKVPMTIAGLSEGRQVSSSGEPC